MTFSSAISPTCRRGQSAPRDLQVHPWRHAPEHSLDHAARARPRAHRHLEPARARSSALQHRRVRGARLDRREGDCSRRRAKPRRGGLHQPPAPEHAPAVRPDRGLRPLRRRRANPPTTPSPAPTSTARPRTTPTSSTACRPGRSPIPAAPRSRRSPIRRAPATCSSSPTGRGGHAFAETYEDHLRNVARWREIDGGAGGGCRTPRPMVPMRAAKPDGAAAAPAPDDAPADAADPSPPSRPAQ